MERKCPNCGKELPEEANFCLYCFTDPDNCKKDEVHPVAVKSSKKYRKSHRL
ncbi:MAG: zinc-ribbon domain-containing protein [Acutalibacteraceae bacterium]